MTRTRAILTVVTLGVLASAGILFSLVRPSNAVSTAQTVPEDCEILRAAFEFQFGADKKILLVERSKEEISPADVQALIELSGKTPVLVREAVESVSREPQLWLPACSGTFNTIPDIAVGTNSTGAFPLAPSESLRANVFRPIMLGPDLCLLVLDCTNCRSYFITEALYLKRHQGVWRVVRNCNLGFA